jgi:GNAT superfamily N-acetyltransferase
MQDTSNVAVHPVTADRFADLEQLFGEPGAEGNCWCVWWRMTRREFWSKSGDEKKEDMRRIIDGGEIPGLIAYKGDRPVAWCSVGPRERFSSLERSRTLKRIDDKPVWSVVCMFVAKPFRGQGIAVELLKGAVDLARSQGARIVEGYPKDITPGSSVGTASFYLGPAPAFREAGFVEAARSPQLVMRYYIDR